MVKTADNTIRVLKNMRTDSDNGYLYNARNRPARKAANSLVSRKLAENVQPDLYTITPAGRAWLAEKEKQDGRRE